MLNYVKLYRLKDRKKYKSMEITIENIFIIKSPILSFIRATLVRMLHSLRDKRSDRARLFTEQRLDLHREFDDATSSTEMQSFLHDRKLLVARTQCGSNGNVPDSVAKRCWTSFKSEMERDATRTNRIIVASGE